MGHLSIRDLRKISGEAISALPGPVAIKSRGRTIALLTPFKRSDPEKLAEVLARADALARERDPAEDDEALKAMGVDPTNWSAEAVRDLLAGDH